MNLNKLTHAFLPAALFGLVLSLLFLLPKDDTLAEASISPDMPVGLALPGWVGEKVQESESERQILAADTKFSKANYRAHSAADIWDDFGVNRGPVVDASIVFSGQDMNASIHRPELCLPAQGFMNLTGRPDTIELADGRTLHFTRLSSVRPRSEKRGDALHFIHYYVFIGHGHIKSTHLQRVMQDMYDRLFTGTVERWAYFQAGTYWGEDIGISEREADDHLRRLIRDLLPRIIKWDEMGN